MSAISYFYGIIIVMYLRNKEYNPPHIHAITQDFDAPFLVATGEIMEGEFPARARAGMSQSELASAAGMDRSDISKIERGAANPSVQTLDRIAAALGARLQISFT